MILFHGSLLSPADLRMIFTTGLRPHPSHWARGHIVDREQFVFASTRVTGSPGGDPMAFARGWPSPLRARADGSGYIVVVDAPRSEVVGTIANDALTRTFAVRAALGALSVDVVNAVLARGADEVEFTPVVTARPRDLPDDHVVVLAFRDDLRRARTARATAVVLKKYGVVNADDVEDLLDAHTRTCVLCVNGRASVALSIPGTDLTLPTTVGGEEVPEATWRFLFRMLREATATHHIDWRGTAGVVDVIAAGRAAAGAALRQPDWLCRPRPGVRQRPGAAGGGGACPDSRGDCRQSRWQALGRAPAPHASPRRRRRRGGDRPAAGAAPRERPSCSGARRPCGLSRNQSGMHALIAL